MINNAKMPVLPQEGFVRLPVVISVLGIGKTTWWCGIKAGRFPQGVKLGPRTTVWRVEDIRALIANPMPLKEAVKSEDVQQEAANAQ